MAKKRRREPKPLVVTLDRTDPFGFGLWIARHLEWMRIRNYSETTVETREPCLVAFAKWCEARGIDRPREVTKPILERYRKHLYYQRQPNGRPLTFGSQQAKLAPLKLFFAWMTRENALLWNPASELELPRPEKRLPRALTIEEVEAVLAQPEPSGIIGVRDKAILETLYSTAMRRSELAHLRLEDIDGKGGTVFIRQGKGKKDRVVPIGERAVRWIDKYLEEARPSLVVDVREKGLFLSVTGEPFTPDALSNLVSRYVVAANIGKRGACHLFRHTAATLMLEAGADVRYIQDMLGHTLLNTTEIYTRVNIRMLKSVHAATHPGAKLRARAPTASASGLEKAETASQHDELFSSLAAEAGEEADSAEVPE
jgi:integrase/recombinase XerD